MGTSFVESMASDFVCRYSAMEKYSDNEPISVLGTFGSPSPSMSTSTLSAGGSGEIPAPVFLAAAEIEVSGATDWERILSDPGQDQFLLRWISNQLIHVNTNSNPKESESNAGPPGLRLSPHSPSNLPPQNSYSQIPNSEAHNLNFPIYPNETLEENPQFLNPYPQIPNMGDLDNFNSLFRIPKLETCPPQTLTPCPDSIHQPPFKRQSLENFEKLENFDSDPKILELYKHPSQIQPVIHQQVVYDQLYKACELILSGNFQNTHLILARLNHQLTPGSKPFQRAYFYLKEALLQLFSPKSLTPVDGLFKMGSYKLFSEVSPLIHFINFTSNQAILEAVGESKKVHIIDFDLCLGAQWASFMAELPILGKAKGSPSLKITAFASPLTHHPFELGFMHENLTQFANEIGINFELEVINLDAFDPSSYPIYLFKSTDKETTLAVNFPIWAFLNRLSILPSLIRFVKEISPKIVVSFERVCDRTDLPFPQHLLHSLQYYEALLDSIHASKTDLETVANIEKFVIQPKIENIVLGRLSYPDPMPHWRALFGAAGFSQFNISNFAETLAECVLKKFQVRGFCVERRQASLVLSWQRQELVTAAAWRC